ncbi:MAG TPA: hypothetical protein VJ729_04670 [Nitrososphaeraceae archaeon]|nr:hypothetical protein [Nitrososphaeraceae archaeon]
MSAVLTASSSASSSASSASSLPLYYLLAVASLNIPHCLPS